jgi:hypothetical protein
MPLSVTAATLAARYFLVAFAGQAEGQGLMGNSFQRALPVEFAPPAFLQCPLLPSGVMDMTTSNIERFDEITGRLLGALYENFPVPRSLLIEHFVTDGYSYCAAVDADSPNDKGSFFIACVDWLDKAGFINTNGRDPRRGFGDCVLTAKGLEILKAVPKSLDGSQSIGEQLVEATKSGMSDQVRDLTNNLLKRGYALAATTAAELINQAF